MLFLLLVFFVLVGIYFFLQAQQEHEVQTKPEIRYIEPSVVYEFIQKGHKPSVLGRDFTILDVRLPREYERGHIRKASNYDVHSPNFAREIKRLSKTRTYIVCAAVDFRSIKAVETLHTKGFSDLYIMRGGMLEWIMQDYPLEK